MKNNIIFKIMNSKALVDVSDWPIKNFITVVKFNRSFIWGRKSPSYELSEIILSLKNDTFERQVEKNALRICCLL